MLTVDVVWFPHINDIKLRVVAHHLVGGVGNHRARVGEIDAPHRRLHLQGGAAGACLHIPDPVREGKVCKGTGVVVVVVVVPSSQNNCTHTVNIN